MAVFPRGLSKEHVMLPAIAALCVMVAAMALFAMSYRRGHPR